MGHGVVGVAFAFDSYLIRRGEQLTHPDLGLTGEQLERFGHLKMVAAMPVRDAQDRAVAVLAVHSATRDDLEAFGGIELHVRLASDIGVLLGDLLQEM